MFAGCTLHLPLQAVPDGGGNGKGKPQALQAWGAGGKGKGASEGSKVRYLDGMVATRAGQKYIVETRVSGGGAGFRPGGACVAGLG